MDKAWQTKLIFPKLVDEALLILVVEESYSGPKFNEEDSITPDFVHEMISWFKNGKKIHKKFAYSVFF